MTDERQWWSDLDDLQLNGFACVSCGVEASVLVPVGHGPCGQLFACEEHFDTEGA